ncbi:MAG: hypothetical protein CMP84_02275 [Gammaproteobacteria bacterium]|nr:hypothetical protein [Gammaproteobacteria bacterium]
MAITKLNSLAIPANTVVAADLSYPLTNFSSTGIDDNADANAITISSAEDVGIGATPNNYSDYVTLTLDGTQGGAIDIEKDGTVQAELWTYRNSADVALAAAHSLGSIRLMAGGFTERARIQAGGGISFNGDTAAANALDDYEEGTCTLSLTSSGTFPTVSYTNQTAYYVKVGKVVTLTWYSAGLNISNAGSGTAKIAGLPYSASTAAHHYPVVNVTHNTATIHTVDSGYAYASEMHLMQSGLTTNLAEWTSGNPKYIMVTITYMTT